MYIVVISGCSNSASIRASGVLKIDKIFFSEIILFTEDLHRVVTSHVGFWHFNTKTEIFIKQKLNQFF